MPGGIGCENVTSGKDLDDLNTRGGRKALPDGGGGVGEFAVGGQEGGGGVDGRRGDILHADPASSAIVTAPTAIKTSLGALRMPRACHSNMTGPQWRFIAAKSRPALSELIPLDIDTAAERGFVGGNIR